MKEKFQELLKTLNNAGHNPKLHELKTIILSHATQKIRSPFIKREPKIILPDGKQLEDFFVRAELSKVDFSKTKVGRKAVEAAVRHNTEIPISVHTAYCNLPNEMEELKAIDNYIIRDGELIEKEKA